MNLPLLDFIADHPFVSFCMAWPTVILLITIAWLVAACMENAINLVVRLFNLGANTLVILIRGYAPQSIEAHPEETTTEDDK